MTNTGTIDLVDVEVNDNDLMLYGMVPTGTGGYGKLAVNETVVLVHEEKYVYNLHLQPLRLPVYLILLLVLYELMMS